MVTMNSLRDAIDRIERRERTLEVYTADDEIAEGLKTQFSTRNVEVTHRRIEEERDPDIVIIRDPDGEVEGSLRIDSLDALLSPEVRPPWRLEEAIASGTGLLDFLDELIFTSYDRRQMLATAREIEERAWRVNAGSLYAGFQRAEAFRSQLPVYNRFATERNLAVRILIQDEWAGDAHDALRVVTDPAEEVGQFWLVTFDNRGDAQSKCALLAEERRPGRYYGFWTYDPELVDDIVEYLESTYLRG